MSRFQAEGDLRDIFWGALAARALALAADHGVAVVPDGNEPHGAKWLDLLMLALFAGRERDEAQWRSLLAESGFEQVAIRDGLVEARCR